LRRAIPQAFLALGSNIDPRRHLPLAATRLTALGRLVAASRVYASPAVGPPGQPDFANAAVLLATDLAAAELRRQLREIESDLGRVRAGDRYAPRPIDLDLILYDDLVLDTPELRLPDPDLLVRPYLAVTVAELDPARRHPVTGETLGEIASRLRPGARLTPLPVILLPRDGVER